MIIIVNGNETTVDVDATIYDIVCELSENPPPSGIAVAQNFDVIPRSQWKEQKVAADDEIEVLWASSGG